MFHIVLMLLIITINTFGQETVYLTNNNYYTNTTYLITNFSFRNITIGMIKSNVEKVIEEDEFLEIDDTSYLGLFDKEKPFVLKVASPPYIKSLYLIFDNDKLFSLIINYNPEIYSYSELLKGAKVKYGLPTDEYPDLGIWQYGNYELRVEKPSTVKFFFISNLSNIVIREYESSRKIKERSEYSKKQLSPF